MKTIASFTMGYASRVLLVLVAAFSCVALAAMGGMTTGCGGSDQAAAIDDGGDTVITEVPTVGFEAGSEISAKSLILEFDSPMKGILTAENFSITDASGNAVELELDWISDSVLRIVAPLPYGGAYSLAMFAERLSASASKADAAPLFETSFTTGPNLFQSGFSVGDVDGDNKADALFHHARKDLTNQESEYLAIITKADLFYDAFGAGSDVNLASSSPSWQLVEADLVGPDGKVAEDAVVRKPVAIVGDVTGDSRADFVVGGIPLCKDYGKEGDCEKMGVGIGLYSSSGPLEKPVLVAGIPMDKFAAGAFGADLNGDGTKDLILWGIDLMGDEEEADGKLDVVAVDMKAVVARANGVYPAEITQMDMLAAIMAAPMDWTAELGWEADYFAVYSVVPVGDLNADGKDDIAISYRIPQRAEQEVKSLAAPMPDLIDGLMLGWDPAQMSGVGRVEIYLGGWDGTEAMPGVFIADAPDLMISGGTRFGFAVAGGDDVNGPGLDGRAIDDLVIGEPGVAARDIPVHDIALLPNLAPDPMAAATPASTGKAYVFYGGDEFKALVSAGVAGSVTSAAANVVIAPANDAMTGFGRAVLLADVVAPAAFADIIVGDPAVNRAFVFAGCRPEDDSRVCALASGTMTATDATLVVTGDEMGRTTREPTGVLKRPAAYTDPVLFKDLGRALFAADIDNSGWKDLGVLGGTNGVTEETIEVRDASRTRQVICMAKTSVADYTVGFEEACDAEEAACLVLFEGITPRQCAAIPECAAAGGTIELLCAARNAECKADIPITACPDGFTEESKGLCFLKTTDAVCDALGKTDYSALDFSVAFVFVEDASYHGENLEWYPTKIVTTYTAAKSGLPDANSMYACIQSGGSEKTPLVCGRDGIVFKDLYAELLDNTSAWLMNEVK